MTKVIYRTDLGKAYCGDCLDVLKRIQPASVDLVLTSPPFALQSKKAYGNVSPEQYVEWFLPYAREFSRVLKPKGSLILDLGGSWNRGRPTRTLYRFELLLRLCANGGPFHLAQEFYWYNPAKIPGPAQWVTIERIRVKDSVTPIWWLSKSPRPRASNKHVLKPYSASMHTLLEKGYNAGPRPSGHVASQRWAKRHRGAIPSNLIVAANTRSKDVYLKACKERQLPVHPARFVREVPEFFLKFLTRKGDLVLDPFAGSNVVGATAESLGRRWIGIEIVEPYVIGSAFRFAALGEKVYRRYKERSSARQPVKKVGRRRSRHTVL